MPGPSAPRRTTSSLPRPPIAAGPRVVGSTMGTVKRAERPGQSNGTVWTERPAALLCSSIGRLIRPAFQTRSRPTRPCPNMFIFNAISRPQQRLQAFNGGGVTPTDSPSHHVPLFPAGLHQPTASSPVASQHAALRLGNARHCTMAGRQPNGARTTTAQNSEQTDNRCHRGFPGEPAIQLPPIGARLTLSLQLFPADGEQSVFDQAQVYVLDPFGELHLLASNGTGELLDPSTGFKKFQGSLGEFAGQQIQLVFQFNTELFDGRANIRNQFRGAGTLTM